MTLEEVIEMVANIQCNHRTTDVEIENTRHEHNKSFKVISEIKSVVKIGGRVVITIGEVRREML